DDMAMVRALIRMTKAGMRVSVRIACKSSQLQGRSHEILFIQQSRSDPSTQQKFDLFNKADAGKRCIQRVYSINGLMTRLVKV
ncbi:hypothetical protein, partial [Klebsiella pneumoniae]|uniref:hypothetical protein n=1 Tax=Klebsiella pneumoniae TaxID=573 RepID=UPI001A7E1062